MNNSTEFNHFNGKDEIAIVGMAGRFPGAKNVDAFWQNLRDGVESISFFTDEELISTGTNPAVVNDHKYVKAGAVLEDIELFDAAFFNFTPREAEIADPQQRLFLECAWEALENAGYDAENYSGQIALFAGATLSSYLFLNLYPNRHLIESLDRFQVLIGNDKDHLCTLTSYKLNLQGPSISVQTTCSTSLVAVHLACQSLLNGESDIALAGGVSIQLPQKAGYHYQEGGINSPDGHCRAFDAEANGTIFGNGLGMVVLKRLEDAVNDGDRIHAVIKGSAINNDGSLKVGYTAPSIEGQREVILEALALAGVESETITYIEAHGTGTTLGDPIEIEALTQAFRMRTNKNRFCAIGSVKTNVGHLNTAAGITGLIKTIQALKYKQIPPSLHFQTPNPQIDLANSPFYVNTKLSEWKSNGTPRRAGVSSFGIGGTNAHVILEETPPIPASSSSRPWQLLLLSAKTNTALETATTNLINYLQQHSEANIADIAYTLQVGRRGFEHRIMVVCQDIEDAVEALTNTDAQRVFTYYQKPSHRPIAFMFSGQGAQYVNMGRELYEIEPIFREQVDVCNEIIQPHLGIDILSVIYPKEARSELADRKLQQTAIAQPALFIIEYALAKLWMAWGVSPTGLIGHSIGEYVAATLAGVFSLEDALMLVATRGKLMQKLPSGSMIAVPLSESELQPFLHSSLSLAAINAPSACVVSGSTNAIEELQNKLSDRGIDCRRLHTSHAFHSEMVEPILAEFILAVSKAKLNPPQIPFISNVTGTWITEAEATNPSYWGKHLRQTVRFSAGISELLKQPEATFLEVGSGRTLSTLTKRHLAPEAKHLVLNSLRHPQEKQSDLVGLLNALGRLWMAGIKIDWSGFYTHESRHRLPLPTYPFERQRYWIDANLPYLSESNNSSHQTDLSARYARPSLGNSLVAPTNELEEQIAEMWQEVLGIKQVGIHDNFFELGGDSLIATQLVSRLRSAFPVELPLRDLLVQASTIAKQAETIDRLLTEKIAQLSDEEVEAFLTN